MSRLENFVGDLKKSIVSLKEGNETALLSAEAATLGEKGMLGTSGGELAAALNLIQKQQHEQAEIIAQLQAEKESAERRVRALEKEVITGYKDTKEVRKVRLRGVDGPSQPFLMS